MEFAFLDGLLCGDSSYAVIGESISAGRLYYEKFSTLLYALTMVKRNKIF